jgi:hypothetical protein
MKLHPSSKTGNKTILLLLVLVLPFAAGCSVRHFAVNMVGDALVSGNSVYETDEDIELVGEALPFGLKLMESLLGESPEHSGLLLTSCKGFVLYSYAYVDYEAGVMEDRDLDQARAMKRRAGKLYLRALSYGLRGLEKYYPGFENQLFLEPEKAVDRIRIDKKKRDLPFLYWSAAAMGLGISVSRDDAVLLARLPEVDSLINRGLELDEAWENGAFHSFKIQLAAAKVGELDYVRQRIGPKLERRLEQKGFKLLHWADAGWVHTFSEDPVRTPEDLRKMKLFTTAGDEETVKLYQESG